MFLFGPLALLRKVPALIVLGAVVYFVVSGVQVYNASKAAPAVDAIAPAQAIVVVAAPAPGGRPGATFSGRLQETLLLYRAHRAPKVLVSDPASGAAAGAGGVGARWLESQQVPASAVMVLPPGSANSAFESAAALLGQGTHVIVVADALDQLWTAGAASAAGLDPSVAVAVGSEKPFYRELGALATQAAGVAVGRVAGYGTASFAAP